MNICKTPFDIKTIAIAVLALLLIFFVVFKKRPIIDQHKDVIETLHKENTQLVKTIDSLMVNNIQLDSMLGQLRADQSISEMKLNDANGRISSLQNKRTVIVTQALNLSANDVSKEFNTYLKKRN
jgi:predicted PurR-regulated permease PerM